MMQLVEIAGLSLLVGIAAGGLVWCGGIALMRLWRTLKKSRTKTPDEPAAADKKK